MITIEEGYNLTDQETLAIRQHAWETLSKQEQKEQIALTYDFMEAMRNWNEEEV